MLGNCMPAPRPASILTKLLLLLSEQSEPELTLHTMSELEIVAALSCGTCTAAGSAAACKGERSDGGNDDGIVKSVAVVAATATAAAKALAVHVHVVEVLAPEGRC